MHFPLIALRPEKRGRVTPACPAKTYIHPPIRFYGKIPLILKQWVGAGFFDKPSRLGYCGSGLSFATSRQLGSYKCNMADFSTLLAVKDLMKPDIVTANQKLSVRDAAKVMSDKAISSIVITDDDGRIVGIITETEIVRKVVAHGLPGAETSVGAVMNPDVHMVNGDSSIFEARHKMVELGVKHFVVEMDGKPVGLISSTSLLGS
jgi:CBS domain-containing protein